MWVTNIFCAQKVSSMVS